MNSQILKFLLILGPLLLAGCNPMETKATKKRSSRSGSSSAGQNTDSPLSGPSSSNQLFWYTSTLLDSSTLTLNANTNTNVSLRGSGINQYLAQDITRTQELYCFVASFQITSATNKKTLRFRAVPDRIVNVSTKTEERFFRLELTNENDNETSCRGTIPLLDLENAPVGETSEAAFVPSALCATCTGILRATNISLYKANNSSIQTSSRVESSLFDLNTLALRIDTSNKQGNTQQTDSLSCDHSECQRQGFDCCVEGLCVKNGTIKENVDFNELEIATASVLLNKNSFVNWPNVYNICSGGGSGDIEGSSDSGTTNQDALEQIALDKKIAQYLCLEEGKKSESDFSVCPDFNNNGTSNEADYISIRNQVWKQCGCAVELDNSFDPRCPNYGLKAEKNTQGTITKVTCLVPPPLDAIDTGLSQLRVNISARTAPHRFFNEDDVEINDLGTYVANGNKKGQEGSDKFFYIDSGTQFGPSQEALSMKAVLGPMALELTQALPAKMIQIELGENYIISTASGSYTPCANCSNDPWFELLKPHPSSSNGWGLQWVGFNTNRQASVDGDTLGNYEDTIFGRACWVPPTMIPFSAADLSDSVQNQRLLRLKTQAALYVNGYQRDWFGFNKGALIGSFDGVSWFAIGPSRRVLNAPTDKLFLAINAPFADLAEDSTVSVSVVREVGNNTASNYDYDFDLKLNDLAQNSAATCQYHHQCESDSDCVTALGWEYSCADVNTFKTLWPKFNGHATEQKGVRDSLTFADILIGNITSISSKRCIYRGAGAPCKANYNDGLTANEQKVLSCAPNFYCAKMDSADINTRIVRTTSEDDPIAFGFERNVLGRPEHYARITNGSLPTDVKNSLKENAKLYVDSGTEDFGICRPGKNSSQATWVAQHQSAGNGTTDYINQIANCTPGNSITQVQSCPVFDEKGNYINESNTLERFKQNSCGTPSVHSGADSFANIQQGPLASLVGISRPTLAASTCLRKPGSVCHTDLDCSPSRLHHDEAQLLNEEDVGGTLAELSFWNEDLVCSSGNIIPRLGSSEYFEYRMNENRCCREIGKDFTMFTELTNSLDLSNSDEIVDQASENHGLKVDRLSDFSRNASGRYSRYNTVFTSAVADGAITRSTPVARPPKVAPPYGTSSTYAPFGFQWKTLQESGQKMCCGSGWVRKLADGTNNWADHNRQLSSSLSPNNYRCLNYQLPLYKEKLPQQTQSNYSKDISLACRYAANQKGCIQIDTPASNGGITLQGPKLGYGVLPLNIYDQSRSISTVNVPSETGVALLDLVPPARNSGDNFAFRVNRFTPWLPKVYVNNDPFTFFPGGETCISKQIGGTTNAEAIPYFFDNFAGDSTDASCNAFSMYLPSYIGGMDAIVSDGFGKRISVIFLDENGKAISLGSGEDKYRIPKGTTSECSNLKLQQTTINRMAFYCQRTVGGATVLDFVVNPDMPAGWRDAGIRIQYYIYGTPDLENNNPIKTPGKTFNSSSVASNSPVETPGNDLYYLTRLSRFELLGIPQIVYEPLYCNDDRSQLIPGIFDLDSEKRTDFEKNNFSFAYNSSNNRADISQIHDSTFTKDPLNPNSRVVMMDKVDLPRSFKSNEFLCCTQLGRETASSDQCCSGHAQDKDGKLTCQLPSGTDLNVYFNRFVSSEGLGDDQPGGGLVDTDFVPETGEPKILQSVANKLVSLGRAYCDSGEISQGSAYGNYIAQPNSNLFTPPADDSGSVEDLVRYYSIVDSIDDFDPDTDAGSIRYSRGFRWNHHFYCE